MAAGLLRDLGWTDIFDLGDLTAARGLEMYVPLWVRMFSQLGQPDVQHQGRPLTAGCRPRRRAGQTGPASGCA